MEEIQVQNLAPMVANQIRAGELAVAQNDK